MLAVSSCPPAEAQALPCSNGPGVLGMLIRDGDHLLGNFQERTGRPVGKTQVGQSNSEWESHMRKIAKESSIWLLGAWLIGPAFPESQGRGKWGPFFLCSSVFEPDPQPRSPGSRD